MSESNFLYHEACPDCGSSDALAVYDDGHTFCFSCEKTTTPQTITPKAEKKPSNLIPDGSFKDVPTRRLKADTLRKFGYSIGNYAGKTVHVAPYRNKAGELIAQHIRFPNKDFVWLGDAKEVCLFGQHLWAEGGRMLIITEGEIDAMSISQIQGNKYPVVSIPSGAQGAKKAIKSQLEWIETFDKVIFAFDSDAPGQQAAHDCAILLRPGKAHICTFPLKDASDMLQENKVQEMTSCIWQSKPYRPDGIVAAKDLLHDILTDPPEGYATPYPELNEKLRGLRRGELYLFTAGSGVGKSTLLHEIGYHFLTAHSLSLGIMALEESKKRTAERYIGIHIDKPIHVTHEDTTEEELTQAFNEVLNNDRVWLYDHFGSTDIDGLMNKIRYMAVSLGIDFLILDHISIVVSGLDEIGESERKTIDRLMTELRSLVEETQIGVMAIVHLKRRDKGTPFTEGAQVSLSDLRGSGGLEQLSDAVIALERNQASEAKQNIALLRVLKNRHTGVLGVCDELIYNVATGRLKPYSPFEPVADGAGPPATPEDF